MSEKLGCLEWWWLGVFIALNHHIAVGEVVCRWAHRTVRCATGYCPVHQPRHPTVRVMKILTVGALTSCRTGQSGAAPDRCCSLSGVPLTLALTSARTVHSLFTLLQMTIALDSHCSAGTPDSPVNYSGARPQKPEGGKFEVVRPWAPDTVRWCTGHCPVAHRTVQRARLGFSSVSFAPFVLNPNLIFLLVCVEPLAPVEYII
jgi:hypothetical protein